jgi:tetratricopeptide (TPR) repeat protein
MCVSRSSPCPSQVLFYNMGLSFRQLSLHSRAASAFNQSLAMLRHPMRRKQPQPPVAAGAPPAEEEDARQEEEIHQQLGEEYSLLGAWELAGRHFKLQAETPLPAAGGAAAAGAETSRRATAYYNAGSALLNAGRAWRSPRPPPPLRRRRGAGSRPAT